MMTRFQGVTRRVAALVLTTCAATSFAAEPKPVELQPYQASYSASLSGVPVSGSADRILSRNNDDSWTLSFKADMFLYSFSEESRFHYSNGQIQPEHYSMEKGALGRKKTAEIHFDWGTHIANSREDDERWKVPLQKADLDSISYQQQLQLDVTRGLKEFHYTVIDEDERNQYTFHIEGEEVLETPVGQLNTVRLKMVRKNNKRQTWIWLARDWDDLLVQLKQTEKGKDYIVSLKSATIGNRTVSGQQPKKVPAGTKS